MRRTFGLLAAGAVLVLAGCSSGTAGDAQSSGTNGSGPISVTDSTGTVKLTRPAKRVVSLEWSYTEDLLTLGVTPVGAADARTYGTWVTAGPKLPGSVPDLGKRAQPSLEKIKALNPDLIIADKSRVAANLDQLKSIGAPVLVFDGYHPSNALVKAVNDNFSQIATAVGKQDKGRAVLAEYDKKVAGAKSKLARAGRSGSQFTLVQGYSANGQPAIRAYTAHSQAGQVLTSIGLRNAWQGKESDPSGFTSIGVEGLTPVAGSTLLYVAQASDNPFTGALKDNATWRNLGFVRDNRVYQIDAGSWFWGGPKSNEKLIDQAVKAFTS